MPYCDALRYKDELAVNTKVTQDSEGGNLSDDGSLENGGFQTLLAVG